MEKPIKVFIVDDHDMVRLGLKTYLLVESTIEVVGEASDGQDAIDQLSSLAESQLPDVILMDLMMPNIDGVSATEQLIQMNSNFKIILLTSFLEDEKVVKAIEAGAVSYVLKTVSSEELVYAIEGAYKGMPVMNTEVSKALSRGLRTRSAEGESEGLTSREKEVLLLIADGKSNQEIADELHISIKTVKTHVSNLLMKCELNDRTQLAIFAHRKGWMQ